jgi:hypothetical protein
VPIVQGYICGIRARYSALYHISLDYWPHSRKLLQLVQQQHEVFYEMLSAFASGGQLRQTAEEVEVVRWRLNGWAAAGGTVPSPQHWCCCCCGHHACGHHACGSAGAVWAGRELALARARWLLPPCAPTCISNTSRLA